MSTPARERRAKNTVKERYPASPVDNEALTNVISASICFSSSARPLVASAAREAALFMDRTVATGAHNWSFTRFTVSYNKRRATPRNPAATRRGFDSCFFRPKNSAKA